ncbi:aldo/keto reductase [Klebsiella pneumoniae]|uniref:Aldo/keto reductase n=1 Tax=Klebsiella pneumoniae TaxID=573 RepID=A0A3S5DIC4_KLEPN|nr:aldo/keto reductase [Klebsiella pneumoniae]
MPGVLRLPSQPLPIIGSGKIERVRSAIVAEKLSMTRQAVVPHP